MRAASLRAITITDQVGMAARSGVIVHYRHGTIESTVRTLVAVRFRRDI